MRISDWSSDVCSSDLALGPILILAGAIQVVAGLMRVGGWFRAISPAVVHGMLAGIGVLIVVGQFHVLFDDKPLSSGLANLRSEEHTSELQSLMRISYAVFCLKKKKKKIHNNQKRT